MEFPQILCRNAQAWVFPRMLSEDELMALHLGTRSFLMETLESCDGGSEKKNQTYLVLVAIHLFWYFSEIRWELRQICESHSFWKISALGCSTVAHLEDTVLSRLSDPSAKHGDCEARSWSGGVWVPLTARIQDDKELLQVMLSDFVDLCRYATGIHLCASFWPEESKGHYLDAFCIKLSVGIWGEICTIIVCRGSLV